LQKIIFVKHYRHVATQLVLLNLQTTIFPDQPGAISHENAIVLRLLKSRFRLLDGQILKRDLQLNIIRDYFTLTLQYLEPSRRYLIEWNTKIDIRNEERAGGAICRHRRNSYDKAVENIISTTHRV